MAEAPTRIASTRSRKVKALLAGGLVLGVGAAVTLAAWTDQEWAEGVFSAGSFNIQGSVDGETFTDHASEDGAAALTFDLTGGDNLFPGATVAAPFVMQLDGDTTYDATVELTGADGIGDSPEALSYGIIQVASADECTPTATGDPVVPANTSLDSFAGAEQIELTAAEDDTAGTPVALCFQVTASESTGDDGLQQGDSNTATWNFVGTSVE